MRNCSPGLRIRRNVNKCGFSCGVRRHQRTPHIQAKMRIANLNATNIHVLASTSEDCACISESLIVDSGGETMDYGHAKSVNRSSCLSQTWRTRQQSVSPGNGKCDIRTCEADSGSKVESGHATMITKTRSIALMRSLLVSTETSYPLRSVNLR